MQDTLPPLAHVVTPTKHFARRLLTIGENRLELLMLEIREERERLLRAVMFALATAVFGFLMGMALTVALIVWLWELSPVVVLLSLTILYAAAAAHFYRQFIVLQRHWQTLPATIDQIKKDCACLEKSLH